MKKPLFNLCILLGAIVLIFAGLAIVLIIAPGVKIFDIQYVRASNSKYEKSLIADDILNYETIEINGLTTDINIEFVQGMKVGIDYKQNFNGFSRSKIESPELFAEEDGKTLRITIREYEKFGYGSGSYDDGLNVRIPVYFSGKLDITTNSSNVTFSGLVGDIDVIKVTTSKGVTFKDRLEVNNLILYVNNKDVNLGSGIVVKDTLEMSGKRADLNAQNVIGQNLKYTSTYGHANIAGTGNNCNIETKHGKVNPIGEDGIIIGGNADIVAGGGININNIFGEARLETKSGKVVIGKNDGEFDSKTLEVITKTGDIELLSDINCDVTKITTFYGDVSVNKICNLEITSKRGAINVAHVNNLVVNAKRSNVYVNTLTGKAVINTTSGDVKLSSLDAGEIGDADIITTSGNVTIYNPSGLNYNITTKTGNVNLFGNSDYSPEINVIAARKSDVCLTNVSGKTRVETKGAVDISIIQMNAPVVITAKNRNVNISIKEDVEVYYNLSSKKKDVLIEGTEVNSKSYYNTSDKYADNTITASTGWGQIIVSKSK